jgi:hypothetical protein
MSFDLPFNVGDLMTYDKKESPFYRRDCIVAYSDLSLVGLITEGVPFVAFVAPDDPNLKLMQHGPRKLNDTQMEILKNTMQGWGSLDILKELPKFVAQSKKQYGGSESSKDGAHIHFGGFVSKELAKQWREFTALLEMAKRSGAPVPENLDQILMEWMIITTMNLPGILGAFNHLRHMRTNMFGVIEEDGDSENNTPPGGST